MILINKNYFLVYRSYSQKVWSSSDSDNKLEDNIDTDDPQISDSDML